MIAPDLFWRYALAVIPVAVAVAIVCRCLPCRPSTRHTLWLSLLLFLVIAPLLPAAPTPDLAALSTPAAGTSPASIVDRAAPAAERPRSRVEPRGESRPEPRPRPVPQLDARPETIPGPAARLAPPASAGRTTAPASFAGSPAPPRDRQEQILDLIRTSAAGATVKPVRIDVPDLPSAPPAAVSTTSERAITTPAATPVPPTNTTNDRTSNDRPSNDRPSNDRPSNDRPTNDRPSAAATQWLGTLRTIRDAVLSLPPIPTFVWAGGAAVLVGLLFIRIARFRRLLATARPASPEVTALIARAAADLKLRRPPTTLMIDARVSPMVWCGRRAQLLLPTELWRDLDELGRHAIVCHELAHLRRRDHWVSWIETIIGCVYWWHPIVWLIRRRLRDEADLSCDAWVTTLMPTARRRYATVLLETKQFTSARTPAVPVVQLGVATNHAKRHAKRFARRLTMVMTQQLTPKLTLGGVLLVGTMVVGAWLVTPTLACDPVKAPKAQKAPKAPKAPRVLRLVPSNPLPPGAPSPATAPAPSTFEQFVNSRGGDDEELEERLAHLEKQLERLREQLGQWGRKMEGDLPQMLERLHTIEIPEIEIPDLHFGGMGEGAHEGHDAHDAHEGHGGLHLRISGDCECVGGSQTCECAEESHTYKLPEGKLEAVTKLMVRADVPVLVSPGDAQITLHGSPAQHHVFGAFVSLINSEEEKRDYVLSEGKLEDLSELMIRADVPVLVSPRCESIRVHGNGLEQGIFGAFVRMIGPESAGENRSERAATNTQRGLAEFYRAAAREQADAPSAATRSAAAFRAALGDRGVGVRGSNDPGHYWRLAEQLEARALALEEQAERLEAEAEEMEERAEEMEERAEELEDERDDDDRD